MKQSVASGALWFGASVMVWVVMFGHLTAVRYMDVGLIALAFGAVWFQARKTGIGLQWPPRYLLWAFGLWAGWAALSIFWSTSPRLSAAGWRDEIGYPFLVFFVFHHLARGRGVGCAGHADVT